MIHRDLVRQMAEVMRRAVAQSDPTIVLVFLKDWWMDHINKEDKKYAAYMRAK